MNQPSWLDRLRQPRPQPPVPPTELHNWEAVRFEIRQAARQQISQTLRRLRALHGLNYETVRQRTGLPQQLLYDIEFGSRCPTLDELTLLAECYDVAVEEILGVASP